MNSVPRLDDAVKITRSSSEEYAVVPPAGGEPIVLSPSGYDLLCRMDGLSRPSDVRTAFAEAWGASLSASDFEDWLSELQAAGLFIEDSRALRALRHLREQGIRFRGGRPDRRITDREDDRRVPERKRAEWFDRAVFLLNAGRLEESLNIFEEFADQLPGDVRVQEIRRHLTNLVEDRIPEGGERRDITWEVFDQALRSFLGSGQCPSCGARLDVDLGELNRCFDCGASYSSFLLEESGDERRSPA